MIKKLRKYLESKENYRQIMLEEDKKLIYSRLKNNNESNLRLTQDTVLLKLTELLSVIDNPRKLKKLIFHKSLLCLYGIDYSTLQDLVKEDKILTLDVELYKDKLKDLFVLTESKPCFLNKLFGIG